MLLPRVLTAIVLVAVLLATLTFATVNVFVSLSFVLAILAFWEWANLSGLKTQFNKVTYVFLGMLCLVDVFALINYLPFVDFSRVSNVYLAVLNQESATDFLFNLFRFSTVVWGFIFLWVVSYPRSTPLWQATWVRLLLGGLVIIPFIASLIYLFRLTDGPQLLMYLIALVAIADSGAYVFGRLFGKHKLLEAVSPGKTWQGFFGGLFSAVAFSTIVLSFGFSASLTPSQFLIMSVILSLVSVLGDLFESMLKRHRGIKDSSNILPGHGGILDRIDSHVVALPIFCVLYLSWM
ncbi:MAG: phosphatidate cytidylyltransferase [Pseudomonadota bacterium]